MAEERKPVWCRCGALIVEEVTETGVKPVGADKPIVFRRRTDYIICPSCLAVYNVRSFLPGFEESETGAGG